MLWPAMESFMSSIQLFCLPQLKPKNPKQPLETLLMLPLVPDLSRLWSQSSAIWVWYTLKGAEALTIFAPSDEAFAKIDPAVLNSLTAEQKKTIVLRHVVTAKVPAAAVTTGPVETIGGETIDLVKTAEGGVQVNFNGGTSNVVAADVMASNGVIHVIDKVIL